MSIDIDQRPARLSDQLAAAGIPIKTVRCTGSTLAVVYADNATQQQQTDGEAIRAAFDPTPKRARQIDALADDIEAWIIAAGTTAQQQLRVRRVVSVLSAIEARKFPGLLKAHGVPVEDEEPDT